MGHRHYVEGILIIVTACLFSFTATVASAATPGCGDANNDQSVTASDALSTLKTAVGSLSCDKVRCDVNDDGGISAADALLVLKLSVGQSVSLVCPGVAIASVSALPQATAPVASEGQDAQASLATSAAMVANLGASGPSAIPIGADDDFFTELGGDVHANPSIGACEMVNRVRNAVNWTAEADKMLCYVKEVMASDTDSSIDLYDGTPHVVELNIAHPGFCAAAPTPTSCRDDAECGADGPCLAFDQQGKDNIHVKLLMARNGDEVDGTITNFEMFVCEDVPSETYDLTIELDDTVTFTALQVEVDYSALVGGFEGFDADVECTSPLTDSGVLFAANDDDASKTLSLGFISLSEVQGPVTLASCSFLEQGAGMQISDFVVTVVDAVDGNGASIRPACSVGEVQGADQGTVQVQYLHQTIDGNSFSMVSKGIFSDEFGTGAHSATVLATLNDLGQFTGSKTINIASSFADAGFGFNGVTEETFIQDANTIYMTGIEQGSFPGEDFDGDGVVDGGADSHLNRVIGYAQLVDGNSDLTDYDIDLLGIGIGAAKASMKGSFSFVPCTMDTCGFEESCERLELAETEDGRCLDEWEFALVEGWNASALVDDAAAVDFISEVVDAELPSYSGVAISFSPSESYDCSGAVEATIDVDMFAIMQTCGEMMVEHDNFASCYDTAGGKEIENCGGTPRCSVSGVECDPEHPCPLTDDICEVTDECSFEDPCAGPNPEEFCFDSPEDFDPCDTEFPPPFCDGGGNGAFGNCCTVKPDPSCDFPEIATCVCEKDDYCCSGEWDGPCVVLANGCGAQCFDAPELDPCAGPNPPFFCDDGFYDGSNALPGDCCYPTPGVAGCEDPAIEATVCAVDSFCCDVEWDPPCVQQADDNGAQCFDKFADEGTDFFDPCLSDDPPPFCAKAFDGAEECCLPHPATGCVDPVITQTVCELDPFCCEVEWDGACVQGADNAGAACFQNGEGFFDPCQSEFPPPFCFDDFGDPCASENPPPFCNLPMPPAGGDCCTARFGEPGCADPEVMKCVCEKDSFCCNNEWDEACVNGANACGMACVDPSAFDPCFSATPPPWCGENFDPCDTEFPPPFCSAGGGPVTGDPGNCCEPTFGVPGCQDPVVEECVCAKDDYCCNNEWDGPCVALSGGCGAQCFGDTYQHPCAGANPEPWCDTAGEFDPGAFDPCATEFPPPWCGDGYDPCAEPNPPAFCNPGGDPCMGPNPPLECGSDLDPCADPNPPFFCTGGGNSPFGDCCSVHGGVGCEDPNVTACVCAEDDYCCNGAWDFACMEVADLCGAQCFDSINPNPCETMDPPLWCGGAGLPCGPGDPGCDMAGDPCFGPFPPAGCP